MRKSTIVRPTSTSGKVAAIGSLFTRRIVVSIAAAFGATSGDAPNNAARIVVPERWSPPIKMIGRRAQARGEKPPKARTSAPPEQC